MRNIKLREATYIRQGRGMSIRAIEAYDYGAMPASKWALELGINTADVKQLLDFDSWHHTGLYAMRTKFYRLPAKEDIIKRAKPLIPVKKRKFWNYVENLF